MGPFFWFFQLVKISFLLELLLLTSMSIKSSSTFLGHLDILADSFLMAPFPFYTNSCRVSSVSSLSVSSLSCSSSVSSKLSSILLLQYTNIKTILRQSFVFNENYFHRGRGEYRVNTCLKPMARYFKSRLRIMYQSIQRTPLSLSQPFCNTFVF